MAAKIHAKIFDIFSPQNVTILDHNKVVWILKSQCTSQNRGEIGMKNANLFEEKFVCEK